MSKKENQEKRAQAVVTSSPHYQPIWHIVQLIPKGRVATYGQIADLAGLPGRSRFVGKALANAPSSLNLPWFRVINSQGKISFLPNSTRYKAQYELLQTDGIVLLNGKIKLSEFQWQPDLPQLLQLPY
ncbi:MGMT family protein [Thalassotalea aquiviva]|uniref:MGMT family protein n=1 Tax=Thalassotalea aquiviva TaxID=3242415 RepID=UPI00352B8A00